MSNLTKLKTAIILDSMYQLGGDDRVLIELVKIFPEAKIYTSYFNRSRYPDEYQGLDIHTFSYSTNPFIRLISKVGRALSFIHPFLFESIDLSDFDLVISLSAGPAKGVITSSETMHMSIIMTPPHYQFGNHRNLRGLPVANLVKKFVLPISDQLLRIWDYFAAQRADHIISISEYIQKIVEDKYSRKSSLIYPPVNVDRFKDLKRTKSNEEPYFLVISRLFEYKKVDRAIYACDHLNLKLKIVGAGPDLNYLKSISGKKIEFLGEVSDDKVNTLIANAEALIFPGTDDFGLTAVEAMAAGTPVLAFRQGGVAETVLPAKTGELFGKPGVPSLVSALKNFNRKKYKEDLLKKHASKFSNDVFAKEFKKFVASIYE